MPVLQEQPSAGNGAFKESCQTHCLSTLNHNLGFCYNDTRVLKWVMKQAGRGFQGVSGSFA